MKNNNTLDDINLEKQKQAEKYYHSKKYAYGNTNSFNTELAVKLGVNEAIFIHRLHKLTKSARNKKRVNGFNWFFNTYYEWQEKFFPFWSVSTVRRTITNLRDEGIIVATDEHNEKMWFKDHTLWFRINYSKLAEELEDEVPYNDRLFKMSRQGCSKWTDSVQAKAVQSEQSITNMYPAISTPLQNDGSGASFLEENQEKEKKETSPISSSRSKRSDSERLQQETAKTEGYKKLSDEAVYKMAKRFKIDPGYVLDTQDDILELLENNQLRVKSNMHKSVSDFIKARIRNGEIQEINPQMGYLIEDYHPLHRAGERFQKLENQRKNIIEEKSLIEEQISDLSEKSDLTKQYKALKIRAEVLEPKYKQAKQNLILAVNKYPEEYARLMSQ